MDVTSHTPKPEDPLFNKYFKEEGGYNIKGSAIGNAIHKASMETPQNVEDLARLICLYVLAYTLVPSTANYVNMAWYQYIVDISKMKSYDWGTTLTRHFYNSLNSMKDAGTCTGGIVPMIPYFILEHIRVSSPQKDGVFPRYLKWNMKEMFPKLEDLKLENVERTTVCERDLKLTPLEEEIFGVVDNDELPKDDAVEEEENTDVNCTQRRSVEDERMEDNEGLNPEYMSTNSSDFLFDELHTCILNNAQDESEKANASQNTERAEAIIKELRGQVVMLQLELKTREENLIKVEQERKAEAKASELRIKLLEQQKREMAILQNKLRNFTMMKPGNKKTPHASPKKKTTGNVQVKGAAQKKKQIEKEPGKGAAEKKKPKNNEPVKPVIQKKKNKPNDAVVEKRVTRAAAHKPPAATREAQATALAKLKEKQKQKKAYESSLVRGVKDRTKKYERLAKKRRPSFVYDNKTKKQKNDAAQEEDGEDVNYETDEEDHNDHVDAGVDKMDDNVKNKGSPNFSLHLALTPYEHVATTADDPEEINSEPKNRTEENEKELNVESGEKVSIDVAAKKVDNSPNFSLHLGLTPDERVVSTSNDEVEINSEPKEKS